MKTNKSIRSRIRKTKNDNLISRGKGHGHFNAKESRSKQLNRHRNKSVQVSSKVMQRYFRSK